MNKTHSMLLRCATIGDGGEARLLAAAKHNLRETGGSHIEGARSALNVVMAGPATSAEVVQLAADKRDAAGVVLKRKDATLAGEIIFGLPATISFDSLPYFQACLGWVRSTFGDEVVLSAVVHNDEGAPHAHVLMQPVRDGRWRASDVFGRKPELKLLLDGFFRDVASGFGLRRAPERLAAAERRALVQDVIAHLTATNAPVMRCPTWAVVRDLIAADPVPFAEQLGIPIKRRRLKTLAELKVSPGKGRKRDDTYIGVASPESEHLCSVGVAQSEQSQHAHGDGRQACHAGSAADPADQAGARGGRAVEGEVRDRSALAPLVRGTQSVAAVRSENGVCGHSHPTAAVESSVSAAVSTKRPAAGCQAVATEKPFSTAATDQPRVLDAVITESLLSPLRATNAVTPAADVVAVSDVPDAHPERAMGLPDRSAGRLGLHTLRDRRRAPGGLRDAGGDRAPAGATTRHRDADEPAEAWDSGTGEFGALSQVHGAGAAVGSPYGRVSRPDADIRVREDDMPAEAWDPTIGEHVHATRAGANACRLGPP